MNRRSKARWPLAAVVALASTLGGAGCFYTDPINTRPDIRIEKLGTDPVQRNGSVSFVAYLDDPDGDTLDLDWIVRACASDNLCDDVAVAPFGGGDDEAAVRVDVPAYIGPEPVVAVRANVVATDRFGAEATDMLYLDVGNAAPFAAIFDNGVRGPFGEWRIDTPVTLAATVDDPENDALELVWDITPPRGVMPDEFTFEPVGANGDYELRAIVGGDWVVDLTVVDSLGATFGATPLLVTIDPDAAPCIVALSPALPPDGVLYPLVDDEDTETRFRVQQVADDLDPYPVPASGDNQLEPTRFRWSLASPGSGGAFIPVGGDLSTFDLDHAQFNPGDELELRVEVDDRQERALPCAGDQATCSVGDDRDITGDNVSDVCLQRQTWALVVGQALP